MENALLTVCRIVFNVVLLVMMKTKIFLLKMFNLLAPYVGCPRVKHRPYIRLINIERYELLSRHMGSIVLARHETPEETTIYAKCLDDLSYGSFKGLIYEKKEKGGKTYCYVYNDNAGVDDVIGKRLDFPFNVAFLDYLFDYRPE